MADLKTKLLEADGGSRELDALIYCWHKKLEFVSWTECRHSGRELVTIRENGVAVRIKLAEIEIGPFSTSLDAALALVEEKRPGRAIQIIVHSGGCQASIPTSLLGPVIVENHKSAPIALCLALLSALEGEE